ncbi:acetate/propionate family kinase [Chitinimonas sp. BJB300]|uniref:acetate/propionate family kinase n=1 Tax=Chitinimonas sp. BJB300 TaxID=1559339 RepID=UPI000C0D0200|nr:acetate/propionate family kinase [Chitinimonas sp. BJB300]PHV10220.1 acetate kinase [Chitinimonas sp. BJB300]TSJ89962.1 acetate/propionate family kinase [Chitinimonas sp. BJB300]
MSHLLTLNAGSSSLKFAVYTPQPLQLVCKGQIENLGHLSDNSHSLFHARSATGNILADTEIAGHDHRSALQYLLGWLAKQAAGLHPTAVAHRIVHGGSRYNAAVVIDSEVLTHLTSLTPLAPLHQPHGLAGVECMAALLPHTPQIACFDTAFHRTQPEIQQRFALPETYFEQGIRRYGFHGLSYQYIAGKLPSVLGDRADGRVIVAHLGNGASACALLKRQSVASSMGFTALDGLMMGTRIGRIDPGVLIYLQETSSMSVSEVSHLLYQQSGLLGVSGISHDMRTLAASEQPQARRAVDLYCLSAAREIAGLCVAIGGLDALVFTAGIGEHATTVRAQICQHLSWLGLTLDHEANTQHAECISQPTSPVSAWVIATDEEIILAQAAQQYA